MREIEVSNTRGRRDINRFFLNFSRSVLEYGTLDPLETEGEGDHRVAYCKALLERRSTYKWETYSYRHYNEDSVKLFPEWVVICDWDAILSGVTADEKAEAYQGTVVAAIEHYFPLKKIRRKNTAALNEQENVEDVGSAEEVVHRKGRQNTSLEGREEKNGRSSQDKKNELF